MLKAFGAIFCLCGYIILLEATKASIVLFDELSVYVRHLPHREPTEVVANIRSSMFGIAYLRCFRLL
jgi:hypothetical protein